MSRRSPCCAACCRAKASVERVLPAPVGAVRVNVPFGRRPAEMQASNKPLLMFCTAGLAVDVSFSLSLCLSNFGRDACAFRVEPRVRYTMPSRVPLKWASVARKSASVSAENSMRT